MPVPEYEGSQEAVSVVSRRVFRLGPRTHPARPRTRRRAAQTSATGGLTEWHLMTAGEREAAWVQLRCWVIWLQDRYELAVEERLPRCWPEHPGLIEELWALKAWREEIYQPGQPCGQAARYWHTELRQVLHAAASQYAAGCRTGHRQPPPLAAEDAELQRRWAAATPLAGIPAADLTAGRHKDQPGHWAGPATMSEAIDSGQARPLNRSLPDCIHWMSVWWMPGAGGWIPVTDRPFIALLDAWASRPDTGARPAQIPRGAALAEPLTSCRTAEQESDRR